MSAIIETPRAEIGSAPVGAVPAYTMTARVLHWITAAAILLMLQGANMALVVQVTGTPKYSPKSSIAYAEQYPGQGDEDHVHQFVLAAANSTDLIGHANIAIPFDDGRGAASVRVLLEG
jgi:hypothetical protein